MRSRLELLFVIRRHKFSAVILRFKFRLLRNGIDEQSLQRIEADFDEQLSAYKRELSLKNDIDTNDAILSFKRRWSMLEGRLPTLCQFCGGIASIFPNTARVEADISTIKREKNLLRLALSD